MNCRNVDIISTIEIIGRESPTILSYPLRLWQSRLRRKHHEDSVRPTQTLIKQRKTPTQAS